MPSLQVRELPENLYLKLKRAAKIENRSLAQETIFILKKALNYADTRYEKRKAILNNIKKTVQEDDYNYLPSPGLFIREDRNR